jgi:hypothetical protein
VVKSVQDGVGLQFGLIGRNDADGGADAHGNLAADREVPAPKKRVLGLDCNAATTTVEFFEDAPRSTGSSNPDTHEKCPD